MLPRIISATGAAVSADEIAAVSRVISTRIEGAQNAGIYRVLDQQTGVLVEYHPFKNVAYTTPGFATDYVLMSMGNPIPYRGVSVGLMPGSVVSRRITDNYGAEWDILIDSDVYKSESGSLTGDPPGFNTWTNFLADVIGSWPGHVANGISGGGGALIPPGYPGAGGPISITVYPDTSGTLVLTPLQYHPDWIAARAQVQATNPTTIKVVASDGEVLATEVSSVPADWPYQYMPLGTSLWHGGSSVHIAEAEYGSRFFKYPHHNLTFVVPEDCIYGSSSTMGSTQVFSQQADQYLPATSFPELVADWAAGNAELKQRRKLWLKKNSDEFIAALKTGFAPGAEGVTRPELQTGMLPAEWEYNIKRDVANYYSGLPEDKWRETPGNYTFRFPMLQVVAFADTVESDTTANLSQAGVRVTRRDVSLQYVMQIGEDVDVRTSDIVGYRTETVVEHNRSSVLYGDSTILSTRTDYDNWYFQSDGPGALGSWPAGVPVNIQAAYMADTGEQVCFCVTGTHQSGRRGTSGNGLPDNALSTLDYDPPYPVESASFAATTPDFIKTWHKDSKIFYVEDIESGNKQQNDSYMHGVTEVHISPFGLIANGAGAAAEGESLGIFALSADQVENGNTVEIYGTAVYSFNWQEGALTFKEWKPLLDAEGNEVPSKIIALPDGAQYTDLDANCMVSFKGLHWPSTVAALRIRDRDAKAGVFEYSTSSWWALVQAIKAG
jgi:hypothetical protein